MISGVLWFVVVFILTGMDIWMTVVIAVVQLAMVLPYAYLAPRKP